MNIEEEFLIAVSVTDDKKTKNRKKKSKKNLRRGVVA